MTASTTETMPDLRQRALSVGVVTLRRAVNRCVDLRDTLTEEALRENERVYGNGRGDVFLVPSGSHICGDDCALRREVEARTAAAE